MKQRFDGEDFECLRVEAASAGFDGKVYVKDAMNLLALKVLQHIMQNNELNEGEMALAKRLHESCLKDCIS